MKVHYNYVDSNDDEDGIRMDKEEEEKRWKGKKKRMGETEERNVTEPFDNSVMSVTT